MNKELKRHIAGIVMIALVVPFFVFASLPPSSINSVGYDIFFVTVLGIAMAYGIFEFTNVISPIKNDKYQTMSISIMAIGLFVSLFAWASSFAIMGSYDMLTNENVGVPGFTLSNTQEHLMAFPWAMFIILFVLAMFVFLLGTLFFEIDFSKQIAVMFVSILLFVFFIGLVWLAMFFGWAVLFLPMIIAITSDTMGLIGGKAYGRTNPFPKISPNKTTAGVVIGLMSAIAIGIGWYYVTVIPSWVAPTPLVQEVFGIPTDAISQLTTISLIVAMAILAPLGDLLFSKMKRTYGVKDFSNLIPGHGGMLDRIDSHIVVTSFISLITLLMVVVS